jgi:hypothetical protein
MNFLDCLLALSVVHASSKSIRTRPQCDGPSKCTRGEGNTRAKTARPNSAECNNERNAVGALAVGFAIKQSDRFTFVALIWAFNKLEVTGT